MQESRLFKILYILLEKKQVTAQELAEKFEVSVRTIYRDIDSLSAAGIPVYTEQGRNGGIHLMDDFVLNKAVLSDEEKQEILTSLQTLSVAPNSNRDDIFQKLSALFQISGEQWLEVDFSRWGNEEGDNQKFDLLKRAIIHHKCVNISYVGSSENSNRRKIHPLKLMYKAKDWYLKAYCTEKEDYRTFKLNRILEIELLDELFVPGTFPEESQIPLPECQTITLLFSKEVAYRVYDEFDKSQIHLQKDGDLIVYADMPEDDWLVGFLLSFGDKVRIIEPVHLKDVLAKQAYNMYIYNSFF